MMLFIGRIVNGCILSKTMPDCITTYLENKKTLPEMFGQYHFSCYFENQILFTHQTKTNLVLQVNMVSANQRDNNDR